MTSTDRPGTAPAQSFRDWSQSRSLADALRLAEAGVRTTPQAATARWLLFELLCVLGHWDRALKQLQTWASLSKEFDSTAHVMRGLIRAEQQRIDVFSGTRTPATVAAENAEPPDWVSGLAQALAQAGAAGRSSVDSGEAADVLRERALQNAPETSGATNLQAAFQWITDSDTRLGPVCEVVVVGAYRWLPFADMTSLSKGAPTCLLDLVWSQVEIELHEGAVVRAYMPMRYPVQSGDRDALLMARETVWQEVGRTGVHARGQKMWTTDVGDMALLDLRQADFTRFVTAALGDEGRADVSD